MTTFSIIKNHKQFSDLLDRIQEIETLPPTRRKTYHKKFVGVYVDFRTHLGFLTDVGGDYNYKLRCINNGVCVKSGFSTDIYIVLNISETYTEKYSVVPENKIILGVIDLDNSKDFLGIDIKDIKKKFVVDENGKPSIHIVVEDDYNMKHEGSFVLPIIGSTNEVVEKINDSVVVTYDAIINPKVLGGKISPIKGCRQEFKNVDSPFVIMNGELAKTMTGMATPKLGLRYIHECNISQSGITLAKYYEKKTEFTEKNKFGFQVRSTNVENGYHAPKAITLEELENDFNVDNDAMLKLAKSFQQYGWNDENLIQAYTAWKNKPMENAKAWIDKFHA